jgi:protein-tyrosine-phosphatase
VPHKAGRDVNEQAVKVMREVGCDFSGHQPRHISAFSDIKFDYVAKMDVPDLGDIVTASGSSIGMYPILLKVVPRNIGKFGR